MDLFTIPFIGFATDTGLALNFNFPSVSKADEADEELRILPLAIDISSPVHAKSVTPLQKSCNCYACTTHHRAFVHHLLAAKEMLGWVLLQIHNHAVMMRFFASIRDSITSGEFEVDRATFESKYESDLPESNGQRPRARGYHFKSEGPSEKRRNKPAWGALGDENGVQDGDMHFVPDEVAKDL